MGYNRIKDITIRYLISREKFNNRHKNNDGFIFYINGIRRGDAKRNNREYRVEEETALYKQEATKDILFKDDDIIEKSYIKIK